MYGSQAWELIKGRLQTFFIVFDKRIYGSANIDGEVNDDPYSLYTPTTTTFTPFK